MPNYHVKSIVAGGAGGIRTHGYPYTVFEFFSNGAAKLSRSWKMGRRVFGKVPFSKPADHGPTTLNIGTLRADTGKCLALFEKKDIKIVGGCEGGCDKYAKYDSTPPSRKIQRPRSGMAVLKQDHSGMPSTSSRDL
jgi:hypothetical protein